ncbi:MAG: hypothetical protein KC996_00635 [Phycisphaerales bacterium]|nr:hypothetical protein [Phycisphaerales bacterium]
MFKACTLLAAALACSGASAQDVLLIPYSTNGSVWVFSAADGTLIDNAFITDPGSDGGVDVFDRPIEAMISASGTILITDQFADVVSEFNPDGSFVGVFSLGGALDLDIMDNIRGGHVLTSGPGAGDVLVTNYGRLNDLVVSQKNVKRLSPTDGSEKTDFAFNRYGGIRGPFDVIEYNGEVLVADEGQDKIVRYTLEGKFIDLFASFINFPQLDFPEQIAEASNGNLLVCAFSSGVILEFDPTGTLVGQYDPGTLDLYRGIVELDNGNLLVTTSTGVYEVTRTGVVVDVEAEGTGFRYITRYTPPKASPLAARSTPSERTKLEMPPPDPRPRQEAINDELGLNRPVKKGGER